MKKKNYNKIFAMLLVVLMFCSCFTSSVFAQENEIATYDSLPTYATFVKVTGNGVNVRGSRSTSSLVYYTANANDVFTYVESWPISGTSYYWYEVIYRVDGSTTTSAYIHSKYATIETRMLTGTKTTTSPIYLNSSSAITSGHHVIIIPTGTTVPQYGSYNGNYIVGCSTDAGSGEISTLYGYIDSDYAS